VDFIGGIGSTDLLLLETAAVSQHGRPDRRPGYAGADRSQTVIGSMERIADQHIRFTGHENCIAVLPIVTLLLGYLFGKAKPSG
jgi:hypothetical protein